MDWIIYNLIATSFFFLLSVILQFVFYYQYMNSESTGSFKEYKDVCFFSNIKRWEAILFTQICCVPIAREIICFIALIIACLIFHESNFITIFLTKRKIKKLNVQVQKAIAQGIEPNQELIRKAEILTRRLNKL